MRQPKWERTVVRFGPDHDITKGLEAKSIRLDDLKEDALEFYDDTISYNNNNNNIANILSNLIRD
jgi:hypothetical protein